MWALADVPAYGWAPYWPDAGRPAVLASCPTWPIFSQDVTVRTVTTSFVIFFGTLFLSALLALGLR